MCPECGGEILFSYETPSKTYRIQGDTLVREDNVLHDNPELFPICSNDREHRIVPSDPEEERKFWLWEETISQLFKDRGLYAE